MSGNFIVRDKLRVGAPIERLWLLAISVPVVKRTLGLTAVEGVTTGNVSLDSRVLWKGRLFGMPQRHLTHITAFQPPFIDPDGDRYAYFQDTQQEGRFEKFQHDHHFVTEMRNSTLMFDEIRFTMPYGKWGRTFGRYVMVPFVKRILKRRLRLLEKLALTEEGDDYLPADTPGPLPYLKMYRNTAADEKVSLLYGKPFPAVPPAPVPPTRDGRLKNDDIMFYRPF